MKLQDKLDAMREKSKSNLPPETVAIMNKATEESAQSGIMERILKPGNELPHFTLPDERENQVSSENLLKNGPLVVTFYRGTW